jgi:hypothetical protein
MAQGVRVGLEKQSIQKGETTMMKKAFAMLFVMMIIAAHTMAKSDSGGSRIEGTWVVTVSLSAPGFPSSFTALETYSRGGGLVTSNNLPPVPRPGQGVWEKKGNQYAVTILFFLFDQNGAPSGGVKVRHSITPDGKDRYTGVGEAEFSDLDGNLLFTVPFTTEAQRLEIESL